MIKVIIFVLGFVVGVFTMKLFPSETNIVIENVKEVPKNLK
ncbi:hypothetical protein M900_2416 [Bacteriovorax sp. Seq25_V]|nr:hypothetical protein M900_2416 [Bacteriovorax sp. Seq25_V]